MEAQVFHHSGMLCDRARELSTAYGAANGRLGGKVAHSGSFAGRLDAAILEARVRDLVLWSHAAHSNILKNAHFANAGCQMADQSGEGAMRVKSYAGN